MQLSTGLAALLASLSLLDFTSAAVLPNQVPFVASKKRSNPLERSSELARRHHRSYEYIPMHIHSHGTTIFIGHHHPHHRTVVVEGKRSVQANLEANVLGAGIQAAVQATVPASLRVDAAAAVYAAGRGRHHRKRQTTLNRRHGDFYADDSDVLLYEDEEPYYDEDSVVVVDDDHYHHDQGHGHGHDGVEIVTRDLLGDLLGTVVGVVDLVSPTVGGLLGKILAGLKLAPEADAQNQFALTASADTKSNVYLMQVPGEPPLEDGSKIVTLRVPVHDEANGTMIQYCAQFNPDSASPSPLIAAKCLPTAVSQQFAWHPETSVLKPLRVVEDLLTNEDDTGTASETVTNSSMETMTSTMLAAKSTSLPLASKRTTKANPCDDDMDVKGAVKAPQAIALVFTPTLAPNTPVLRAKKVKAHATVLDEPIAEPTATVTETLSAPVPTDSSLPLLAPAPEAVMPVGPLEDVPEDPSPPMMPLPDGEAPMPDEGTGSDPLDGGDDAPVEAPAEDAPTDEVAGGVAKSLMNAQSVTVEGSAPYVWMFRPDGSPIQIDNKEVA